MTSLAMGNDPVRPGIVITTSLNAYSRKSKFFGRSAVFSLGGSRNCSQDVEAGLFLVLAVYMQV